MAGIEQRQAAPVGSLVYVIVWTRFEQVSVLSSEEKAHAAVCQEYPGARYHMGDFLLNDEQVAFLVCRRVDAQAP